MCDHSPGMTDARPSLDFATDAALHVVRLGGRAAASVDVVDDVVHRIFEGSSGFLSIEIGASSAEDAPLVHRVVSLVRDRRAASGRSASVLVRAPFAIVTPALARALSVAKVPVRARLSGAPTEAEVRSLRDVHAAVSASGTPPLLASFIAEIPVNEGCFEIGAGLLVDRCLDAGLSFFELVRDEEGMDAARHREFALAVTRHLLDRHEKGRLLVEMSLALHLETLALQGDPRRGGPRPEPRKTIWTPDGQPLSEPAEGFGEGCAPCRYDPYCGRGLLRDRLENLPDRREGTAYCARSKAMFEIVTALSASPDQARVRSMFRLWWAAHKKVAAHLASA